MTIRDIAVAFGIEVDQKSVSAAENAIKGVKNMASKLLGAIGIGFSIAGIANLAEAAADAVGMSRGYFSTKFREVTGETFHNCVIRYKMKTAAQEIRKGEKSMTEIALELGYDNFYYFSKLFRKEYGCTPGEF